VWRIEGWDCALFRNPEFSRNSGQSWLFRL
jgi:hypothetical protein